MIFFCVPMCLYAWSCCTRMLVHMMLDVSRAKCTCFGKLLVALLPFPAEVTSFVLGIPPLQEGVDGRSRRFVYLLVTLTTRLHFLASLLHLLDCAVEVVFLTSCPACSAHQASLASCRVSRHWVPRSQFVVGTAWLRCTCCMGWLLPCVICSRAVSFANRGSPVTL